VSNPSTTPTFVTAYTIERVGNVYDITTVETGEGTIRQANDRATVLCEETGKRHRVLNPFGRVIYTAVPTGGAR
jgi:hypothetical protein